MTVSLRRMSAGAGYQYLLRSVAAGDGDRRLATPLTRYYAEAGTPPGRWMGSGLSALGGGKIRPGAEVSEAQLALLIGMGRDPVTGEQLGRAYPEYPSLRSRVEERVGRLDPALSDNECSAEVARIEVEEAAAGVRRAVAGYDLTFSVPKSVSVLWGISDAATQERIVAAHHAAMGDVLAFFEREVAATRTGFADTGAHGDGGAVAQVEVAGVAAVAYDHYDSRAGDPQLHTHLVVSNKVLTVWDGRWRSLDGRPVHAAVTGLSAHYNALLADRLSRELGVEWEPRERGADRNPQWEIVGVEDDLVREFSSRSREIDLEKNRLIAEYRRRHGRLPSEKKIVEIRAQATLTTRPPKRIRSLLALTAEWRQRATQRVGADAGTWAATLIRDAGIERLAAADVPLGVVNAIGRDIVATVGVKRSTWSHWNLMAEASRQTMDLRFATTADREAVVGLIVDAAQRQSVALTPPELVHTPAAFRRTEGTSVFRPRHSVKYSSITILEAEARLLDRAETTTGPRVRPTTVYRVLDRGRTSLSAEQAAAVASIAWSGHDLDLLVGPAGAGKTTTMRALRRAWVSAHGQGSVVGLAPSAAAAQALADDLGISCDNTAKWLHDYDRGEVAPCAGQLVIIDEATLAGTAALDRITSININAGAKVLLVGDPHQLQSVDAGGAFALLVERRSDLPELTELHRFTHDWEKKATLGLREGDIDVIATYARHQRIREGSTDDMLDAAYDAWRADITAGRASILVADSAQAVRALNERARAERIATEGAGDGREVALRDDMRASVGDVVFTRRNDRTLRVSPGGWVRNGGRWTITKIRTDGSIVVRRASGRGSAVLPARYVREHLELGYAFTAHRAQGITVDASHAVVTSTTPRANLYVAMSRGRLANHAYVVLDQPDDSHNDPGRDDATAHTVLYGVLSHEEMDLSATQSIVSEHRRYASIGRLAAELELIAVDAQRGRFTDLLRRSGLTSEQHAQVVASEAFGPLSAALRCAEAYHHDLERLVRRAVSRHSLSDADDVAAVLRRRIQKLAFDLPRLSCASPNLIAGLIPEPLGAMSDCSRRAVQEYKDLIEERGIELARTALAERPPWLDQVVPTWSPRPCEGQDWFQSLVTTSAFRDRYKITSDSPLGASAKPEGQNLDRRRARAAIDSARVARGASNSGGHRLPTAARIAAGSGCSGSSVPVLEVAGGR